MSKSVGYNIFYVLVILIAGVIGFYVADHHNKKIQAEQLIALTATSEPVAVSEPVKGLPGFDPGEVDKPLVPPPKKQDAQIDEAAVLAQAAVIEAKQSQQPEDMVAPTFYSDMDGNERDVIDRVYDRIWLDAEKRTGVNYKKIAIEDIYRIDDLQFHPDGMNSYEAYVMVNKKCQIVSFSINFQNQNQFQILGDRKC